MAADERVAYVEKILNKYDLKSSKTIMSTNLDFPDKTGSFIPVLVFRSDIAIPTGDKECVSLVDGYGFEIAVTMTVSFEHNAIILDPIRALKDNIYYLTINFKNFKFKVYGGSLHLPTRKLSFVIGDGPLPQKIKEEFEAHLQTKQVAKKKFTVPIITSKRFLIAKPFASLSLRIRVQTVNTNNESGASEEVHDVTFRNVENLDSLKSKISDMLTVSEGDTVSLSLLDSDNQIVDLNDDGAVMALNDKDTLLVSIITDDALNLQQELTVDEKIERKRRDAIEKGNFIDLE